MIKRLRFFLLLVALAAVGCGGSDNSTVIPTPAGNSVPTLTSISTTTTLAGSTSFPLDLTGTGFVSGSSVKFGTTALTTTFVNSTQLQVTVPDSLVANAAIVPVSVSNPAPGGGTSNALDFTVANPLPTLDQVSLLDVLAGSSAVTLEITGSNFNSSTQVTLGTATLAPSAFTKTTLSVAVPDALLANAGIFGLSVFNPGPGGGSSTAREFTVSNRAPSIDSISVSTVLVGSSGFTLDITGNNFVSGSLVEIGGSTFTPSSITTTQLSVAIPDSFLTTAAIHNLTVLNPAPGGGPSEIMKFMVANPSPTLNSLSYSLASVVAGKGDFTLTISGKDFMPEATVDIGGSTGLTPASITASQITVVVPSGEIASPKRVNVTVHNPAPTQETSNVLSFMVNSEPTDGIWAQAPWQTVVNAGTVMPNSARKFNSYTQPAVNRRGLVAFRAHSKGTDSSGGGGEGGGETTAAPIEQGEPVRGIYKVDMGGSKTIEEIATGTTEVPWPNNTTYQDGLACFNEFPSIARIAIDFDTVAFRGQSQPVWTYTNSDGTDSRAGSAGVYVSPHPNGDPLNDKLRTGIGLLGAVPLPDPYDPLKDFSYMQVPGAAITPTRFDQFPGSPALADQSTIAFKGNYTEGDTSRTGVFFRDVFADGGRAPVQLVANSTMIIPNQPEGGTVVFGSTAPPSAAEGSYSGGPMAYMVFSGFDNEDAPTLGGIYRAALTQSPLIETLVGIGDPVPGESATFNRLGEGVSFDGRYVGFWGAWGSETKPLLLICATDGNKDMIASCNEMYPNGFETTVPVHQGIFVYDTETKQITTIAKTGDNFDDFVYWVFSGRPPNVGGGGEGGEGEDVVPEPPRWRSSSFVAVSGKGQMHLRVAFKGKIGSVDGVYLRQEGDPSETQVLLDTTLPGQNLDPLAPAGASITSVGIERDGFRGDWLVLTTGMLDPVTSESWSGIYAAHIPQP